jgi:hypothetical protein
MIGGAAIVLGAGRWPDALSLGEETARSPGAETGALGLRLTLGAGLMAGGRHIGGGRYRLRRAGRPALRAGKGGVPAGRHDGAADAGRRRAGAVGRYPGAEGLRIAARRLHVAGRRAVPGPRDPPVARRIACGMIPLAVRSLVCRRGTRAALESVGLAFAAGELTVIVGPTARARPRCCAISPGSTPPPPARSSSTAGPIAGFAVAIRARRVAYLPQGALAYRPLLGRDLAALGRLPHGVDLSRPLAPTDARWRVRRRGARRPSNRHTFPGRTRG